jgi:hypothetical protein
VITDAAQNPLDRVAVELLIIDDEDVIFLQGGSPLGGGGGGSVGESSDPAKFGRM